MFVPFNVYALPVISDVVSWEGNELDVIHRRVQDESGLDDPDNPGHLGQFFGGSSGCHPQTKLSWTSHVL